MGVNRTAPVATYGRCLLLVTTISFWGLAHGGTLTIVPEISVSETYSNNLALTSVSPIKGWISDIAPSLHITDIGSRAKANLDYRLDSIYYPAHPTLSNNLNSLNSNAAIEAIDNWLFIDGSANIIQRKASAFDPSAVDSTSAIAGRSETRTVQFSPYVRNQLSDLAAYQVRINSIASSSNNALLATTYVNQVSGSLKNASAGDKVGWFMNSDLTLVRNALIGKNYNDRFSGGLNFETFSKFHLLLSDGTERTNYTGTKQVLNTPGLGIEWSPSPRTQVAALREKRFFGTGHSLLFNHRTALTNWRYTDTKDVGNLPALLAGPGQGAIEDLMSGLLAASIPDPVARAEAVHARLDQAVLNSNQPYAEAIQTSRLFIGNRREASVALTRSRDTVTFSLTRFDQQAIGNASVIVDSFALSDKIRQQGVSLAWLHLLTPLTTLSLATVHQNTEGSSVANLDSSQSSHTGSISYRIDPKTSVSMGGRIIRFNSTINGIIHEYAVVGSLTHHF